MPQNTSRWSVVAAFAVLGAATQILWVNYATVTTGAAESLDVSTTAIGWLAQVFPLFYIVLAIPAGIVLDRWFRPGLAVGALLTAMGGALRIVDDTFLWALIGQCVVAIGQPLVLNAIPGLTGRYLAERDRPLGITIGTASTFGGLIIGFLLGAVFPESAQLPTLVAVGAAIGAVGAAAVLLALLVTPARYSVPPAPSGFGAARTAWQDGYLRKLCLLVAIPFGTFIALSTWTQALLEPAGISESAAGLMLVVNVVAGVAATAVIPVWAARRGRQFRVVGVAVAVTAAACALLALFPGTITGFLAMSVIGMSLLPALPMVLEIVERRDPAVAGTAAGLVWMAGNLGGLVVASGIGLLLDHPSLAFLALAAITLLALPLVVRGGFEPSSIPGPSR